MSNSKKKSTLDKQLSKLTEWVEEQNRTYESSRDMLYKNLVDTYFWWQDASKINGYLESLYKAEGIRSNRVASREYRQPILNVVKLVFAAANPDNQLCLRWADAIEAIHREYTKKPKKACYKRQPKPELFDWIRRSGGITKIAVDAGLREAPEELTDDYFKDVGGNSDSKLSPKDLKEIITNKRKTIKAHTYPESADIYDLPFEDDEIAVVLVKKTANGKASIIGSTNNNDLINTALTEISVLSTDQIQSNIRLVSTAISIHALPAFYQRIDYEKNFSIKNASSGKLTEEKKKRLNPMRRKFFPKASIRAHICSSSKQPKLGKPRKIDIHEQLNIHPTARLVIKTDGSILCSYTNMESGLTTIISPNKKFKVTDDLFLRGSDRHWIETDLLGDEAIALYSSDDSGLVDTDSNIKAEKQITFTKTVDKTTTSRSIYFYPTSSLNEVFKQQTDIADKNIEFDWSISTTTAFARRIYSQHLRKWMFKNADQFRQNPALSMKFAITGNSMSVHSKWREDIKEYSQDDSLDDTLVMLGNLTNIQTTHEIEEFTFSPTDAIQCFKVASEAADQDILISGNAEIMKVEYTTEFGLVQTYIPSCDTKGKRIKSDPFCWYNSHD